jgi:hypothetical protein
VTKRFDSPKKFFPHLLWLIGGTGDRSLCPCVLCGTDREPKELREKLERVSLQTVPLTTAAPPPSSTPLVNAPIASSTATPILPQPSSMGIAPPSSAATPQPGPVSIPINQTARSNPTPVPVPTYPKLPEAAPPAPQQDEPVIFREGEVVWYKNNNAWRIGIVLMATAANMATNTPSKCLIQPLAHAFIQIDTVLKTEPDMRPFLAFSVPAGMFPTMKL